MRIFPIAVAVALSSVLLGGCATTQPVTTDANTPRPHFDPAPMPFVQYSRRGGTTGGLEMPIPPKMPLGTGAVPVSSSPVRGSIVSGVREAF
jgi:hypothetical protein